MHKNKVALISGGTSGIGLATAKILSEEGWKTVLLGRDKQKGNQAEAQVKGGLFISCDIKNKKEIDQAVEHIKEMGELCGVVSSAGVYKEGLLENMSDEDTKELFDTNVFGTIQFIKTVLPYLKRPGGSIVTVSSDAATRGNVQGSIYSATKGAVTSFTRSLALELAVEGIRANVICPGDVKTPLLKKQLENYGGTIAEMENWYPLMRIAKPEEVGQVIAFLLSEKASFMTGAIVPVDGGLTDW